MPAARNLKADSTGNEWVSAPTAAKAVNISVPTLYLRALRGEYRYQVVAGRVFVHRDSLPSDDQQKVR